MSVMSRELMAPGWADGPDAPLAPVHDTDLPCHRADPESFFSESPEVLELAKRMCTGCPLRQACLEGALERSEPWGVWGGEIFEHGAVVAYKRVSGRPRSAA